MADSTGTDNELDGLENIASAANESARWVEAQDKARQEQDIEERKSLKNRGRNKKIIMGLVIAFSILFVLLSAKDMKKALTPPREMRQGSYQTDATTDECIHRLWLISARLQKNEADPVRGMACPASGKPYRLVKTGDLITVECPDPEAHKARSLYVTNIDPIPEVVK